MRGAVAIVTEGLSPTTYRGAYGTFARFLRVADGDEALEKLFSMSEDEAFEAIRGFRDAELDKGNTHATVATKIVALNRAISEGHKAGLTDLNIYFHRTLKTGRLLGFQPVLQAFDDFKKAAIAEYLQASSAGMQ
jgi:hypothetical protein